MNTSNGSLSNAFSEYSYFDRSKLSRDLNDISDKSDSNRETIYANSAKNSSLSNFARPDGDDNVMEYFAESIVGGFLNLGEERGWTDGGTKEVGDRFIRLILNYSLDTNQAWFVSNRSVCEKVRCAFGQVGVVETLRSNIRPSQSRFVYDGRIQGVKEHGISRILGNVASTYGSRKPFFEVIVDSARIWDENGRICDEKRCCPFSVTIFENEKDLEERYRTLKDARSVPAGEKSISIFYHSDLKGPKDFLREHQNKIGPNGTRILEALEYLQNQKMRRQEVGNCWMKQPMRALLASFYLELVSDRKDLSYENAWKQANTLYKCIQQNVAIPYIESLLEEVTISPDMEAAAREVIARRKAL